MKTLTIILSLLLGTLTLAACSNGAATNAPEAADASPSPAATAPAAPEATEAPEAPTGASLITNGGAVIDLSTLSYRTEDPNAPEVFYISDITPEAMVQIYEALNWTPSGKVAVKLSTGEPPASNYLAPQLIRELVEKVDGTIVECNTAYGGSRSETAMHYQVAEDHGFTDIADFQILDENGSMELPVNGGTRLSVNYVGAAFGDYDDYLVPPISRVTLWRASEGR